MFVVMILQTGRLFLESSGTLLDVACQGLLATLPNAGRVAEHHIKFSSGD